MQPLQPLWKRTWIGFFQQDTMCECLVHKQPCWAYPAVGYEYGLTSDASAAAMLGEPSAKKLRPWRSNASGIELARPAWWTQRAILGHDPYDPFSETLVLQCGRLDLHGLDRLGQAEEGQWHHQQVRLYLAS